MPNIPNILGVDERLRVIATYIVMRLEEDEAFREEVKQDPAGALKRLGVPETYIRDHLRTTAAAHPIPEMHCVDFTCWFVSACIPTCYITID